MSHLFLYKNGAGGVAVGYPTPEALQTYSITEIALKAVPTGEPFWVVGEEYVPNDHTFFNAWELDLEALGEPDGYGIDYEDWALEYKK